MGLITCPDCGRSVSDAAPACIHCGRPMAPAAATAPPDAAPVYAAPPAPAAAAPMRGRADARAAQAAAAKPVAMVAYGLQLLAFAYFIPGLVALVVAYVKRGDARGTWVESHFDWQIETFWNSFWAGLGAGLVAAVLMFLTDSPVLGTLLLYVVVVGLILWYIYRVVRGALALYDERPIA